MHGIAVTSGGNKTELSAGIAGEALFTSSRGLMQLVSLPLPGRSLVNAKPELKLMPKNTIRWVYW
jgi:hypothetical protein